jgi:[ribosomal protein S5]-alanine N-acetyltransferase
MNIITQTPRLIIREFSPEEENTYLDHFNDEEVCRHIPKRSRDERINIFHTALANYAKTRQTGTWGMFDKHTGDFIGSCLLRAFDGEVNKTEIGYSIQRNYWGNGIATEMVKAMVGYALADADTKGVVAVTTLENIASQRVLEKAGLVRRNDYERNGEVVAFFKIDNN